jgi:hypothetical protein
MSNGLQANQNSMEPFRDQEMRYRQMNWQVLFKCFMTDVKRCGFSQRRKFFEALTERAHKRCGVTVAWPHALLFIEPEDWQWALNEAGMVIET